MRANSEWGNMIVIIRNLLNEPAKGNFKYLLQRIFYHPISPSARRTIIPTSQHRTIVPSSRYPGTRRETLSIPLQHSDDHCRN